MDVIVKVGHWSLLKENQHRIEAFKVCCFRRLRWVSRSDHKTNEWVLDHTAEDRQLLLYNTA